MDILGSSQIPPSPVVRLQYHGAVYDSSIRVLPGTNNDQLCDAVREITSFPPSTPISLLRLDHQGELVTDPRLLNDGELIEVMEGAPEDGTIPAFQSLGLLSLERPCRLVSLEGNNQQDSNTNIIT
jgi:hypothetical protein